MNQTPQSPHNDQQPAFSMNQLKPLLTKTLVVALITPIIGIIITMIAVSFTGMMAYPIEGERYFTNQGIERFDPAHSSFRKFRKVTEADPLGYQESQFDDAGFVGTSIFLYQALNAYHWTLELHWNKLGPMLFLPLLVLVGAVGYLYHAVLPASMRRSDSALAAGIAFSFIHALLLCVLMLLVRLAAPSVAELYSSMYGGDFLGTLPFALVMIIITNLVFGGLAGIIVHYSAPLINPKVWDNTPKSQWVSG